MYRHAPTFRSIYVVRSSMRFFELAWKVLFAVIYFLESALLNNSADLRVIHIDQPQLDLAYMVQNKAAHTEC